MRPVSRDSAEEGRGRLIMNNNQIEALVLLAFVVVIIACSYVGAFLWIRYLT